MAEHPGELHLKMGSMYAEKTTELIRQLLREKASGLAVVYVNYDEDNRNPHDVYSTHNPVLEKNISGTGVIKMYSAHRLADVWQAMLSYDVIGIDEGQFFSDLYEKVLELVEVQGKIVYVAGLDSDKNREQFGQLIELIPIADSYEKLYARCMHCAKNGVRTNAIHTHCKVPSTEQRRIGAMDLYEALCRKCYLSARREDTASAKIQTRPVAEYPLITNNGGGGGDQANTITFWI